MAASIDPSDLKSIAPFCMPVIELIASTANIPQQELLREFELNDVSHLGSIELKFDETTKKIHLLLTKDNTYETNIAEEADKLPDELKAKMLNCAGYLILLARIFYKRLLQEYPNTFTRIIHKVKDMGKDPSNLGCLGVNMDKSTLYLEEEGQQIGLLVV